MSDEKIFELIAQIESEPCLWQKSHKYYQNKYKKSEAIETIAKSSNITSELVKEKLKSLRTIYFQNAQKLKKGKSGSAGGVQVKWKFFNALNFLQSEVADSGNTDTLCSQKSVRSSFSETDHLSLSSLFFIFRVQVK